jgi:hypothetical protein
MATSASAANAASHGKANGAPILSTRALNRALLARQMLLERSDRSVLDAVRHLFGMQAQAPLPPYTGLWTRLRTFDPHELGSLIESRQAVRLALQRDTVHLVTSEDARMLRPLLADMLERRLLTGSVYAKRLGGLDTWDVAGYGRTLVEAEPRTMSELRKLLSERWPGHDGEAMAMVVRNLVPLVQIPPRGVWGKSGLPRCTSLESWLGADLDASASLETMVLRYLAAYGPASVMDAQAWCGLTKLSEVFERLRPRLAVFRDEQGRELFDLPEAPRPDAETPAPPRLLPEFDNLLLAHADRTRVMSDAHRKAMWSANGIVPGSVLVDGFTVGTWKLRQAKTDATLSIALHAPISPDDRAQVEEEGRHLLDFASGSPGAIVFSERSPETETDS